MTVPQAERIPARKAVDNGDNPAIRFCTEP